MKLNLPVAQAWYLTFYVPFSLYIYWIANEKSSSKKNVYFILCWCVMANPFLQIYFFHNFVQLSTSNSPTQAHNYRYGTLVLYCIKKKCFYKLFSTRIKVFLRWCVGVHFIVKWMRRQLVEKEWWLEKMIW